MVTKIEQIEKTLGGLLKEQLSYRLKDIACPNDLVLTTQEPNRNIDRISIGALIEIGCTLQIIYVQDNKIHISFDTTGMKQALGDLF